MHATTKIWVLCRYCTPMLFACLVLSSLLPFDLPVRIDETLEWRSQALRLDAAMP